jgi:hypothetical protein
MVTDEVYQPPPTSAPARSFVASAARFPTADPNAGVLGNHEIEVTGAFAARAAATRACG